MDETPNHVAGDSADPGQGKRGRFHSWCWFIGLALLATAAGCQGFLADLLSSSASSSYSDPGKYQFNSQRYADLRDESDRPRPLR